MGGGQENCSIFGLFLSDKIRQNVKLHLGNIRFSTVISLDIQREKVREDSKG